MTSLIREARLKGADKANRFMSDDRDRFVMTCVREGSQKSVDCMLEAKTWDSLLADCNP